MAFKIKLLLMKRTRLVNTNKYEDFSCEFSRHSGTSYPTLEIDFLRMKKLFSLFLCSVLSLYIFSGKVICQSPAPLQWKAGAASVDITPALPMWMAGYGKRDKPGNEVAHPIHAKALAIRDAGGDLAIIVTMDILGIPGSLRASVERQVSEKYGITPSFLLMNASHTHSGPEVRSVETFLGKRDPSRTELVGRYRAELEKKIMQVIEEAFSRLAPAVLAYGRANAGFAMNRRMDYTLPKNDPRYGKVPSTEGPVDHDVPVLQITGENGSLVAVLFGYACHATTLGEYTFHGDYPGFAQYFLEEAHPGAIALFLAGCGADQNPYPRGDMVKGLSGLDLAKMHGRTLALAVEAALNASPRPLEPDLDAILEKTTLEYLSVPGREELVKQSESKDVTTRENAQVLLERLDRDGRLPSSYPYTVQVVRFGKGLILVALASETVVDYSLRLKKELQAPGIWIAGYSNDFLGYIPSSRIWSEGGYEGGSSLTFSSLTLYRGAIHPTIWAPSVEKNIVAKVHEIAGKLNDRQIDLSNRK
jgi:hypothetical protein